MSDLADAPFAVAQRSATAVLPEAPFARKEPAGVSLTDLITQQHFLPVAPRAAASFEDYLKAGFQQSVTGLAARGKVPDVTLDQEAPWYARLSANVAGLAGDMPAMVAGGALGAAGGIETGPFAAVTGMAGAFALPAGLRAVMMDAYSKGEFGSASEFVDRALHIAWETGKGWITGAATGAAGGAARAAMPVSAATATKVAVPTAAEIAAMTTVSRGLEGQLPEPQDFLDAAIVLGGVKAAGAVSGRLRTIYARTGKTPTEVLADAARDPSIREDLLTETKGPALPAEATPPLSEAGASRPAATPVERLVEAAKQWDVPRSYVELAKEQTARAIVPGDKAAAVAASPFAEIQQAAGEPSKPTHVNYNYINGTEDAKAALSRLSRVYEEEIQTQRRGTVSWEQTSNEAAAILSDTLGGIDKRLLMPREPGTPAGAAEIIARKQLVIGAAEAMMAERDNLLAKGDAATPADQAQFLAAIERASMIQSEFLGARAEAGRALNILKSTAMDADRARMIQDVITMYGKDKPLEMARMLKEIDNPAAALKFAKDAVKATTWEKVIEAWKASILSGPVTHVANIIGNTTFAALRAPVDAVAALIGVMRSGPDKVTLAEPLSRMVGLMQGTMDGLKAAGSVLRTGEQLGKSEQFRKAIEGTKGEIVRLPFRALSAEDAVFSTMNERGELYSQAANRAAAEGLNPATREFRERIATLVNDPTPEMTAAAKAAGERFTFNTPLGPKGQAVQGFVRAWHLEWMVPFIRTPGNIFKELTRMTPFAPFIEGWRNDIKAGGAARDRAIAELAVGSATMTAVFMHALDGSISGQGDPDPGKRRIQMAAGWQPYSVKLGDTWYSYQRLQPLGTMIGLAADMAAVWDHATEEEADKIPKMLSIAFANAVTNQTFLQGITNIVNAMSDPKRFGPKLLQQYAGSVVPAIVAQPTQMLDPSMRQVDGSIEAIKARIPGLRGDLLPKRDPFGEPIQTKARLGGLSPITETVASQDKVRMEAARLGISAADTPKKAHIGKGTGKVGDVKLEPSERDVFADVSGHLAHDILSQIVNSPGWDDLPELVQKRAFAKVFAQSHKAGAAAALPMAKRLQLADEITQKMTAELTQE